MDRCRRWVLKQIRGEILRSAGASRFLGRSATFTFTFMHFQHSLRTFSIFTYFQKQLLLSLSYNCRHFHACISRFTLSICTIGPLSCIFHHFHFHNYEFQMLGDGECGIWWGQDILFVQSLVQGLINLTAGQYDFQFHTADSS